MKPWMIWDIEREREEREKRERANEAERAIDAPPPPPPGGEPERREETKTLSRVRAASLQMIGVSIGER